MDVTAVSFVVLLCSFVLLATAHLKLLGVVCMWEELNKENLETVKMLFEIIEKYKVLDEKSSKELRAWREGKINLLSRS